MRLKVLTRTLAAVLMGSMLLSGQTSTTAQTAAEDTLQQEVRDTVSDGNRVPTSGNLALSSSYDSLSKITDWEVHNSPAPEYVETDPRLNPDSDVEELLTRLTPHPYFYLGPSLLGGGGYAMFAYRAEGGFNVESRHWVMKPLAAYDNGRKVDDNDQPNPNGHDRYLDVGIYFRPSSFLSSLSFLGAGHWFFGAGYRWSQLSTTNYTKGGNRPQIGGGYDLVARVCSVCRRDLSVRLGLDWVMAGNDWQNGSHGPETTITFPTLRENRHWFFQDRIAVYRFHETVTEPTNAPLTRLQESQKGIDNFVDLGIVYRF